jgi:hypothetical protein
MQERVCTSEALRGKCSEASSPWHRAKRPTITACAVLALASVLPHQSTAQVSSQARTALTQVRHALSPEILAMHARAKRPVATAPTTSLELAATTTALASTGFNSEQGPGPSNRSWPRVQFVPCTRVDRHDGPAIVLWTAPFRHQSQLGRTSPIAGYRCA